MKSLNELINERLKLNKDTKIYTRDLDNWSIENAEPGDIVKIVWFDNVFFAYKETIWPDIIKYYWYVNLETDDFESKPDIGVGTIKNATRFVLASEEDKQKIYDYLKKKGYKWDEIKLNLKKL